MEQIWEVVQGNSPLVATAIHDGHKLRPEVATIMALTDAERLREEDPFTAIWTQVSDTRLIGNYSRFERKPFTSNRKMPGDYMSGKRHLPLR